ncbi:MAG: hypothetical protein P1U56_09590 [Saprospiraceae bacterium]|nr:hypothetical protein [Saprospiraceae bacterium]
MRMNEYTSIDLPKATFLPQSEGLSSKLIEKLLLILIAILGIIGSLYVFTNSSNNNNNSPNYHNLSMVAASVSDFDTKAIDGGAKFKDYIKIEGKKKIGQMLNFKFKKDRKAARYVMDMGNGERVIITADEFPYTFDKPGKYTLELKTINRGLISTVATKEIKIKD